MAWSKAVSPTMQSARHSGCQTDCCTIARLLLPFAEDGVTVDSLGGASLFELPDRPLF